MFAQQISQYVEKIHDKISRTLGLGSSLRVELGETEYVFSTIDSETIVGDVSKEAGPIRAYGFDPNSTPGYVATGSSEEMPNILVTNFGAGWDWVNEQDICDYLALIELHELAHWAEQGQGYTPESGGSDHSDRWNPVIEAEIDWIQDGESAFNPDGIDLAGEWLVRNDE